MIRQSWVACWALAVCAVCHGQRPGANSPLAGAVTGDGWVTGSLDSAGLSSTRLAEMEKAIRSDEFKKIGSVVIARNGNLVFERYFDGDATTLRDTRSATKSITDVL